MRPFIACAALTLCAALCACSGGDKDSFRNVDHDRNGKISYEELLFVFPDVTPEIFAQQDTNGDGSLSEKEYRAFLKADAANTFGHKPKPSSSPAPASKPKAQSSQPLPGGSDHGARASQNEDIIEVPVSGNERSSKAKPEKGTREAKDAKGRPDTANRSEPSEYTVQRGDNLSRIARHFGVSVEDIVRANGNMNPDTLRDGQTLVIPARP